MGAKGLSLGHWRFLSRASSSSGTVPFLDPKASGWLFLSCGWDDCVAVDLSVEIAFCESAIGTRRSL